MIDDLKAMAIFAETVKRGSFRAAAKSLQLSPSVVSYQISQLEERLGTTLLYRSTRKLSKTAEGETLFNHATVMLDQAELGIQNVSGHNMATGKLNITLPLSMTSDVITKQIADFSKQNPGIEMHVLYSDNRLDLTADGIDLAFRMGSLPDSALNARKVALKERTLACSPEYYAKHPVPKTPEDLIGWNWIKHDMLPGMRSFSKDGKTFNMELKGNISANSAEAMVKFALYGLGISTAARWLIEDELADGRLVHVLPDWTVEPMPLYAVWHGNITECSNTRKLLNFLKDN
ncbi:MAG: LysR family transcriptional regulator [Kordiimonadaceae bacterium]|nr:LysR family transcriptional regulator [Kordiimonadaceae bacterium]MBT6329311.1 LysR family transcriptional regulator [Kordiimonadaceae bacterium]